MLHRRELLLGVGAVGLMGAARKPASVQAPVPAPADAALSRALGSLAERMLQKWPETAASLGLDKDKRAALKSRLNDRSWDAVVQDRALCADGLKAPVSIDEILEALRALDNDPRHPPGGKPNRQHSTDRLLAA